MSITDITDGILAIIPIGGAVRLALLAVSLMWNEDEEKVIKKKMINALKFIAVSASVYLLKNTVLYYYK